MAITPPAWLGAWRHVFFNREVKPMRTIHLTACYLALLAGCSQPVGTGRGVEDGSGPGRFPNAVIQRTIAPWDGAAVQLFLSEKPLTEGNLSGPRVSVRIYQSADGVSKQRVRLAGEESRAGFAAWIDEDGKAVPLRSATIDFEAVVDGKPVKGRYDLVFPDGKGERGGFEATWWKAEGPGG
jgi:hypothetical protein